MMFLVYLSIKLASNRRHKIFAIGLLFSSLGDLLLELDRGQFFIYGLGAFFVAHLFYIKTLVPLHSLVKSKNRQIFATVYLVYGVVNLTLIFPNLESLLIPVLLYMLVLMLLGISTLLSHHSNNWLILGGVFFVISDSLIGLNKFYTEIPFAPMFIMITYYFAQYSLFRGIFLGIQNDKTNHEEASQ
jgi:alkenylglycerophosphocholine/alkenylglycerophosphoethanolamine hydrolase